MHESRRGGLQMCNLCELCALDANGAASKEERERCVVFNCKCEQCAMWHCNCNVQCTSSEEGGEVVYTLHLLQCHRRRERWVKVCSLCKMGGGGEQVHKCASVYNLHF